ncbi:MAG: hypothetical protein ACE5GE_03935 [Phycisphaerae bacterium]
MRLGRLFQFAAMMASGAMLLQLGGCSSTDAFEFIQTILLGVTAAGAVVIIQNV